MASLQNAFINPLWITFMMDGWIHFLGFQIIQPQSNHSHYKAYKARLFFNTTCLAERRKSHSPKMASG